MKRITKLTPGVIKRIINEERKKIHQEKESQQLDEQKKLLQKLRFLKKIKNKQMISLNEAKQLHIFKKKIISNIKKGKK
jgi:hypothetical protein